MNLWFSGQFPQYNRGIPAWHSRVRGEGGGGRDSPYAAEFAGIAGTAKPLRGGRHVFAASLWSIIQI